MCGQLRLPAFLALCVCLFTHALPKAESQLQRVIPCPLHPQAAAINGLDTTVTATHLEGVRNMRAFLTTRLIDHYEQLIFQQGGLVLDQPFNFSVLLFHMWQAPEHATTHKDGTCQDLCR